MRDGNTFPRAPSFELSNRIFDDNKPTGGIPAKEEDWVLLAGPVSWHLHKSTWPRVRMDVLCPSEECLQNMGRGKIGRTGRAAHSGSVHPPSQDFDTGRRILHLPCIFGRTLVDGTALQNWIF